MKKESNALHEQVLSLEAHNEALQKELDGCRAMMLVAGTVVDGHCGAEPSSGSDVHRPRSGPPIGAEDVERCARQQRRGRRGRNG